MPGLLADHPTDEEYVRSILEANRDKLFVQRILNPDQYPELPLGDGRVGTHKMAWGESDGRNLVFPTIMYQNGLLKDYGMDEGYHEAMRRNQYIELLNPQAADWFSRNYKAVWPQHKR